MPTPQFNVRVPERYHALLRLIVERLRANPAGADALADALLAVCRQPDGSIGVVVADSLPTAADTARRLDSIESRLGALERRAAMGETGRVPGEVLGEQHAVTRQPRPLPAGRGAGGGAKRLTDEQDRQIADMLKAGRPYSEIAASVGVSSGGLTKIKKRLAEQGLLTAKPAKDEAGEGPSHPSTGEMTAIPDEHSEQAYLCEIAGMTIAEAIELKGWPWKEHELAAAVEQWRERHRPHVMLLLEQHRQVAAMLKADKSAEEIKAWLDLQKAELPASRVDENPAPPPSSTD